MTKENNFTSAGLTMSPPTKHSTPEQIDDNWVFPLTIASNDAGLMIELSYYCDKLHRIFTINWTKFDASVAPTGTEGIYKPEFVK